MSQELNGTLTNSVDLIGNLSVGAAAGTDNYNDLINKPSINNVILQGNKSTSDLLIDYDDLLNKPTIPAAPVNSDWNSESGLSQILNKPEVYNKASLVTKSSADIVTFSDGLSLPYNEVITDIDNTEDGISNLVINSTGKNLVKYPYSDTTKTQNGITFTDNGDGSITISGVASNTTFFNMELQSTPIFLNAGTYTRSAIYGNGEIQFNIYKTDSTAILLGNEESNFSLTEPTYIYYFIRIRNGSNFSTPVTIYPQLEIGSTATEYEAYTGTSLTVSLGQTVYGGSLNVTTGELTITHDSEGEITPVTSYITAYNVNCLSGYNALYSTAGDVSCKYYNEVDNSLVELIKTIVRGLS